MPSVDRISERTIKIGGRRYKLASDQTAKAVGETRSYDETSIPRQGVDPRPAFEIPLTSFHDGYGYTFANSELKTYERANGWDATAQGRLTTVDRAVTLEPFTSAPTRGYIVDFGGYVYVMRGEWSMKYRATTGSAVWQIVGQHYFGSTSRVAGPPAVHEGHLYVPLQDLTADVINRWHRLSTVNTNTTETQVLTETGSPTGGTFTLNFNDGLTSTTTAALAFNITVADLQTALRLIPGLNKVTVTRTGTTTNFVWTISMPAAPTALASNSPPALVRVASLTGGSSPTVTVTTTTVGVGDQWDRGPAGAEAMRFFFFENKLTRAVYPQGISSASADPLLLASWGTVYDVLDVTRPISSGLVFENYLVPIKTDTIATFDQSATAFPEPVGLEGVIDPKSGVGAVVAHGYGFIPHRTGLLRWRPGGPFAYVGAEQDGQLDSDRSLGHGRVTAMAPFGKSLYFGMLDSQTGGGIIGSLTPGNGNRGPYTPHMHHFFDEPIEDVKVVSYESEAITSHFPATVVNDATVGTTNWTNPSNISANDNSYATATGAALSTKYLKATGFNFAIPLTATIQGIFAVVRRKATGVQTVTSLAYTGGSQSYVVPANVTSITADLYGATGGSGRAGAGGSGWGHRVVLAVTPGETLTVNVGGVGGGSASGAAGFNGGGAGGIFTGGSVHSGGGGGASDIRRSATKLAVAGGGGGGALNFGGPGGGTVGGQGFGSDGGFGGGGTSSAGGVGGAGYNGASAGSAGSLGSGGAGGATGTNNTYADPGGGGGGGYYGGGGGGGAHDVGTTVQTYAGTGGGGSSYNSGGALSFIGYNNSGSGIVVITAVSTDHIDDTSAKLIKGGTISGSERAYATNWAATEEAFGYGGPVDLHGLTLTPADVNDSGFGFAFAAVLSASTLTASVDSIEIQVYFTLPGGTDPTPFLLALTTSNSGQTCEGWVYDLPSFGQTISNDAALARTASDKDFYSSRYAQPAFAVKKQWHTLEGFVEIEPEVNVPGVEAWAVIDDGEEFRLTTADGSPRVYTQGFHEFFFPPDVRAGGSYVQIHLRVPATTGTQEPCKVTLREAYIRGVYLPLRAQVIHCVVELDEEEELDGFGTPQTTAIDLKRELLLLSEPGSEPTTFQDIDGTDGYCHVPLPEFKEYGFRDGDPSRWVAILDIRKLPGLGQ